MDIEKNIRLHDKIAKKYEATHGEISKDNRVKVTSGFWDSKLVRSKTSLL